MKLQNLIDVLPDIKLDGNLAFIPSHCTRFNMNYSYKLKGEQIFLAEEFRATLEGRPSDSHYLDGMADLISANIQTLH